MKVSTRIKLLILVFIVMIAYGSAWMKEYSLSQKYFGYAEQQYSSGHLIRSLKGMNKLELRIEDEYFGGYQQVIDIWKNSTFGPKPDVYYESLEKPQRIIESLSKQQLMEFIVTYVQLDSHYVTMAADQLRFLAKQSGDTALYTEMTEFLTEAFPHYQQREI